MLSSGRPPQDDSRGSPFTPLPARCGTTRSFAARPHRNGAEPLPAHLHDVTVGQLPAAPHFRVAVYRHSALGEERLHIAAGIDQAGELEELPEPDRPAADGDVTSGLAQGSTF